MASTIFTKIFEKEKKEKLFALLLDPDKCDEKNFDKLLPLAEENNVNMILVGGSFVKNDIGLFVSSIKKHTSIPVVLFPGNASHFCPEADAILLLSLISGRNADFLIGNHVLASNAIKKSGLEVIPTGYILIDGGVQTSVQYMSNTMPIPSLKVDIAVATALAGEQLGLKMIYLEGGSGAKNPVPVEMIRAVRSEIKIPLIVGGGLKTPEQVNAAWDAGADMVVVGNALEDDFERINLFTTAR